jgi:trimeric autotransporter adhesin
MIPAVQSLLIPTAPLKLQLKPTPHKLMKSIRTPRILALTAGVIIILGFPLATTLAQGTAFTYQGRLNDGVTGANGIYDVRFAIYDAPTLGTQQGPILTNSAIAVSNGLFAATLDFGNQFSGANRWLEIGVRTNGSGSFFTLSPRQALTPAPYAITAGNVISGGLTAGTYGNAVTFNNANNSFAGAFTGNGANVTNVNAATLNGRTSANFWGTNGNAGADPANGAFIGTSDNLPLEFKVNGQRALRLEPNVNGAPNVIGGSPYNFSGPGVVGATIAGGGAVNYFGILSYTNQVVGNFGSVGGGIGNNAGQGDTVGGGQFNSASQLYDTVGGGNGNSSSGGASTVGGGEFNSASQGYATVGGGHANNSSGTRATVGGGDGNSSGGDTSTVAGGHVNVASGTSATVGGGFGNSSSLDFATVGGGRDNTSSGLSATVSGGNNNSAGGDYATVPGGNLNLAAGFYSFAAGRRAKANHQGSFVWADSQNADFTSTAVDQFSLRAAGGVRLNTDTSLFWGSGAKLWPDQGGSIELGDSLAGFAVPYIDFHYGVSSNQDFNVRLMNDANGQLTLSGSQQITGALGFGNATRQMLNLFGSFYGIGVQSFTMYFRTDGNSGGFSWFKGGVHSDSQNNPGGGTELMRLDTGGNLKTLTGTIASLSDRNAKTAFQTVDVQAVLAQVAALPISTWRYKNADASQRHLGPMAQDFYSTFGIGLDDKSICTVDEGGVALAAIQGLNQKFEEQRAENADLKQQVAELKQLVLTLTAKH